MVELGDLYAAETAPAPARDRRPGDRRRSACAKVCDLELRWVDIESMQSELATIPVSVSTSSPATRPPAAPRTRR